MKGQGLLDGLVLRLSLAKVATVFQQGFTAYLLAVAFLGGLGQQTVTHVRFATMLSVPAALPAALFGFCRVPQAVCA